AANCDTSSHGYANSGAGGHRHARTSSNCHPVANLHSRPADANSYPDTYTGASDARAHSYTAYTDAHAHAHTRSALARSERDLPRCRRLPRRQHFYGWGCFKRPP
ncbi:MAG: hypothetical protein J4N84_13710, partial [Chloroflexi bacterium]|nr:hypothetical protein [Chloroflexota bacterium]